MQNPNSSTSSLHAGAARADITPELGIQLAGALGTRRPVEEIRDPLYANVLVLESHGRRVCILSLDLLATNNEWSDKIRKGVAQRYDIDSASVMVHAVQNHAAPSLGHHRSEEFRAFIPPEHAWLRGGDDRYNAPTVAKCLDAVGRAVERLEPVTLRVGRGIEGRVAFNRRYVLRDGTARMCGPRCNPQILQVEGPMDPEVGVMTLTNEKGLVVSTLQHFTSHPCHGYPNRFVIADWPGAWAEIVHKHFGEQCVPLVINGCCGNIVHQNSIVPDFRSEYHDMANKLAETTLKAVDHITLDDSTELAMERTVVPLALRSPSETEIREAQSLVDAHPEPMWLDEARTQVDQEWIYAVGVLGVKEVYDRGPHRDYEIQACRIGGNALVALMGEPFVEVQLRIKEESPADYTFVAHFCNGYASYVPTAEAIRRGGYETRIGLGSDFQPEAIEKIGDAAIGLLNKLF